MKMVLAVVHEHDAVRTVEALAARGFAVTKLASEGGFLQQRNVVLLTAVDDLAVDDVVATLRTAGRSRHEPAPEPIAERGAMPAAPVEVEIGRATVFVLGLDRVDRL
ncbi:MAG TPA: cyclic-di-AMP receptor [Candidatus Micrarchaeia archaeon]|nr:cyclic-di-AMP receptor [Candidatus Micrarchaeia archaeon]